MPPSGSRYFAPLSIGAFRLLFLSTLGSSLGTLLASIALAIDVKDRTDSGLWVGAVLVVEFLPTIVVGLLLGPLIDRLERRSLMVVSDLVRVGVFAALPFANSPAVIVGLALVAGLANGFFRPAVFASVPNLVSEELLPEANALLQTVENASWAVGPLLGGLIVALAGPSVAYWINAVSFLASAVLIGRIPARKLQSERALSRGHWRDLADGFAVTLRSRPLLAVLLAWGIGAFGTGAVNVAEVFLAKDAFDAGDFGYGLLYSAIGIGLLLGSFSSSAAIERVGTARTYGLSLGVMAVAFGGAALSPGVWIAAACCLVGGIGNGGAVVCNNLLVQRGAPDALRGRALTFVMSATFAATGVGTAVAGALLNPWGPRWIWGAAAVLFALAGVVGYALVRGVPQREQEPVPEGVVPASE